jgi:hypothetical protein
MCGYLGKETGRGPFQRLAFAWKRWRQGTQFAVRQVGTSSTEEETSYMNRDEAEKRFRHGVKPRKGCHNSKRQQRLEKGTSRMKVGEEWGYVGIPVRNYVQKPVLCENSNKVGFQISLQFPLPCYRHSPTQNRQQHITQ